MVLWEITLATAYWLGLRKTYRLALKLQRRVFPRRYPRVRDFLHRRTRNVFDVALSVHKSIQTRDLSQKKSVSNYVLRILDRARPSANISGSSNVKHLKDQKNLTSSVQSGPGLHNKFFLSQPEVYRSQVGQTIRSRFSGGVGRMCPGSQSTRADPGIRTHSSFVSSWDGGKPFVHHRDVFRPDIAKWMGRGCC